MAFDWDLDAVRRLFAEHAGEQGEMDESPHTLLMEAFGAATTHDRRVLIDQLKNDEVLRRSGKGPAAVWFYRSHRVSVTLPESEGEQAGQERDPLQAAYEEAKAKLADQQGHLGDLETALALRQLMKARGLEQSDLERAIKLLKDND